MLFMISQTKAQRVAFDRSDLQRNARGALGLLDRDVPKAGLGLPSTLALQSLARPGTSADSCGTTPELTFAAVDFTREWTIASGTASTLTLSSATPVGGADVVIKSGTWLFVFQNNGVGNFGMVQVGADRAAGATTIAIGSTNYNSAQTTLSLAGTAFNGGGAGGHAPVMLVAEVLTIGVNCTSAAHPCLYMRRAGGERLLLAPDVDTRALTAASAPLGAASGDVVALRFRFLVDDDTDGFADDRNADNQIDTADLVVTPTTLANVVGVEVSFRLRRPDASGVAGQYETNDFAEIIMLPNVHTSSTQSVYVFIDNSGLRGH
jgi:hypothetical protein